VPSSAEREAELRASSSAVESVQPRTVLTVGHSTLALPDFVSLLRSARVAAVADVRRFPASRRHPHFTREPLEQFLAEAGLEYEHLPELGGRRSAQRDSPNDGWTQAGFLGYADHLRSDEFTAGLERLERLASSRLTAVMCAEGMWWRCHRRLVADVLMLRSWRVRHVLPDGREAEHELPDFAVRGPDGLPLYPRAGQRSLL
jgi:uncharacterized protein (DUF488 family)